MDYMRRSSGLRALARRCQPSRPEEDEETEETKRREACGRKKLRIQGARYRVGPLGSPGEGM